MAIIEIDVTAIVKNTLKRSLCYPSSKENWSGL